MAVIGIDAGSTFVKAEAFDDNGTRIGGAERAYSGKIGQCGEALINTSALEKSLIEVLRIAVSAAGGRVDAVCVSSFGESFVTLGKNGEVLFDPIAYSDPHGAEECESLVNALGREKIVSVTGAAPDAMFSLPKIMYINSQLKEKPNRYLLIGDYIGYLLCGEGVISPSLAARTMAYDITKNRFDPDFLSAAGTDESMFSVPLPSGEIIGEVSKSFCQTVGIKGKCLVVNGGHDQVMAALGAGVTGPGGASDGTGTVECITAVFDKPDKRLADYGYVCVPYPAGGFCTYAFNFAGGALIAWFKEKLLCSSSEFFEKRDFYSYFEKVEIPTSLTVLPYFAGEATPCPDGARRGIIEGLSLTTTAEEVYAALMEGAAMEMRLNLETLSSLGITVSELTATGGGAKSPLWLKIKADVMNLPVLPLKGGQAGITGAAMLALTALKRFSSLNEAARVMCETGAPYLPGSLAAEKYDRKYERYKKLRSLTIVL